MFGRHDGPIQLKRITSLGEGTGSSRATPRSSIGGIEAANLHGMRWFEALVEPAYSVHHAHAQAVAAVGDRIERVRNLTARKDASIASKQCDLPAAGTRMNDVIPDHIRAVAARVCDQPNPGELAVEGDARMLASHAMWS
jgi:hypothetical protein